MRADVARQSGAGGQRGRVSPNQSPPPYGSSGPTRGKRGSGFSRTRGASPFSPLLLAFLRFTRSWRLLLAVSFGMLVAIVLICTVPLYDSLIANVQLQRVLHDAGSLRRNMEVRTQSDSISAAAHSSLDGRVSSLGQRYLAPYVAQTPTYYVASEPVLLGEAGTRSYNLADIHTPQLTFEAFDYGTAASHMRFVAGQAPQASSRDATQVIITQEMAQAAQLKVGDSLLAINFGDHSHQLALRIVGIWTPVDPNDDYWNGLTFTADNGDISTYPVLLNMDTFFSKLQTFPGLGMTQHWVYYTRLDHITSDNAASAAQAYDSFVAHAKGDLPTVSDVSEVDTVGDLSRLIGEVQTQQSLLELPLYAIVVQIIGLALLFVTAMATLLIEGQRQEIATLKSRGASGVQLLGGFTLQAAVLALLAALVSPFLAALLGLGLVRWFIPAATLRDLGASTNAFDQLANPQAVILPATVGALLGVGVVAVAALQSARLDVLAFRHEQGRQSRPPLWRRYYLDLGLVVLCLIGYMELSQFGGLGTRETLGANSTSPLLLVTPALLLLAGALLVLRVFPLGAGVGARFAARRRGLTTLLAFSQVERAPGRYSRMTLLLVLAVGLGLFAITFDASLQRNAYDRAAYTAGTDMRITENVPLANGTDTKLAGKLAALPGVRGVSPAFRSGAAVSGTAGTQQVDTLGIDPATFAQVAGSISWRDDYASRPLDGLLRDMQANQRGESGSGSGTAAAGPIWALVSDTFAQQAHVHIGDHFTLQLNDTALGGLTFVVGAVVHDFPTLYPLHAPGGFVVLSLHDNLLAIKSAEGGASVPGANEFWLRTSDTAATQTSVTQALTSINPDVRDVVSLRDTASATTTNPIAVGMRGLLLVGAFTAALLAVLGSIIQSLLASRQRSEQFAVLRTVGMTSRQIGQLLLSEQLVVYLFGLIGGTVLGMILTVATLPFLEFSDVTLDPSQIGVPPYTLAFNASGILYFYLALLVAFALALIIASRFAASIGLGKALRIGED
ncbi:MAG: FtsX-like permease family protein [Ktedonobacterales bacterium]